MALVAALYPVESRGLPLGLVSAVQEFGSVLGPLFGAAVLAFTSWQGIFAINCAAGLLLWVAVRALPALRRRGRRRRPRASPAACAAGRRWPPWSWCRSPSPPSTSWSTPSSRSAGHHLRRGLRPSRRRRRPWTTQVGFAAVALSVLAVARDARRARRPPAARLARRDRPGRGRLPRGGAGRYRPGVRDRRPRGVGVLRAGPVLPARLRSSRSSRWSSTCAGPGTRWSPAAPSPLDPPGGRWWSACSSAGH